jgi:hypothetical protein
MRAVPPRLPLRRTRGGATVFAPAPARPPPVTRPRVACALLQLNAETEVTNPDGSKSRVTAATSTEADGARRVRISARMADGKAVSSTYEMVDGGTVLLVTITVVKTSGPSVVVRRFFKRK